MNKRIFNRFNGTVIKWPKQYDRKSFRSRLFCKHLPYNPSKYDYFTLTYDYNGAGLLYYKIYDIFSIVNDVDNKHTFDSYSMYLYTRFNRSKLNKDISLDDIDLLIRSQMYDTRCQ